MVKQRGCATSMHRAGSNPLRQGIVVNMGKGTERHLHISGTTFRIPVRYNYLEVVGKGSYGVVCAAVDTIRRAPVAIKKITPMAARSVDAKRVLREVRVMRHLGQHENIVTLEDLFCNETDDELYIVMELLHSDLHRVIHSPQVLTIQHVRLFMLQILRGVEFLHENNVIHRDLKPGNILVTRDCELRISDFGLARERPSISESSAEYSEGEGMTKHMVTRWYRPPELMLSPNGFYSFSADLWSVGCIFGELISRRPLFPGSTFKHQLSLIFDAVGAPTPEEVAHIRGTQAWKFLETMKGKAGISLFDLLPGISVDASSLLETFLVFDPDKRCTAEEALRHHFFDDFRNDHPLKGDPPTGLSFDFEHKDVAMATLRDLIAKEVDYFQSGANLKIHSRLQKTYAIDTGRGRDPSVPAAVALASTPTAPPATSTAFMGQEGDAPTNRHCSNSSNDVVGDVAKARGAEMRAQRSPAALPNCESTDSGKSKNQDIESANATDIRRPSSRRRSRSSKSRKTGVPASPDPEGEDEGTEFYAWLTTEGAARLVGRENQGRTHQRNGSGGVENGDMGKKRMNSGERRADFKAGSAYWPARARGSTEDNGELCAIEESDEESSPWRAIKTEDRPSSDGVKERGGKREADDKFVSNAGTTISDTSTLVGSFVSPACAPAEPTRGASVAGFSLAFDGWDDAARSMDSRMQHGSSGGVAAVAVLSPASLQHVLCTRGVSDRRGLSAEKGGEVGRDGNSSSAFGGNGERRKGDGCSRLDEEYARMETVSSGKAAGSLEVFDKVTATLKTEDSGRSSRKEISRFGDPDAGSSAAAHTQSAKLSGRPPRNDGKWPRRASAPLLPPHALGSKRLQAVGAGLRSRVKNGSSAVSCSGVCGTARKACDEGKNVASNLVEERKEKGMKPRHGDCLVRPDALEQRWSVPAKVMRDACLGARGSDEVGVGRAPLQVTDSSENTRGAMGSNAPRREIVSVLGDDGARLGDNSRSSGAPPPSSIHADSVDERALHAIYVEKFPGSVESRCSPPPVPPPLGKHWGRRTQAEAEKSAGKLPLGCLRGDGREHEKVINKKEGNVQRGSVSLGMPSEPVLSNNRAECAAGRDAGDRRDHPLVLPVKLVDDSDEGNDHAFLSTSVIAEPGDSSSAIELPVAAAAREAITDEGSPIILKLPSRFLSPTSSVSSLTQPSSDDESDVDVFPLPPTPVASKPKPRQKPQPRVSPLVQGAGGPSRGSGVRGNDTPIVLRLPSRIFAPPYEPESELEETPPASPLDEPSGPDDDLFCSVPATAVHSRKLAGERGRNNEMGTIGGVLRGDEEVVKTETALRPKDRQSEISELGCASAPTAARVMPFVSHPADERNAEGLAGRNTRVPRQVVKKPCGYPIVAAATRPDLEIKESPNEDRREVVDEESVGSTENRLNILQRLWKRSSTGKRGGELDALSAHVSGPSVFDGGAARGGRNEPFAMGRRVARQTLVIEAAPSVPIPENGDFKEVLTTACNNCTASTIASSVSPASSAASRVDGSHATGSGVSPTRLQGSAAAPTRAFSAALRPQAAGRRRETYSTVPPLRADFPATRETSAKSVAGVRAHSRASRENVTRESAGHGMESWPPCDDAVGRGGISGDDPCVEDQYRTPQCCAPPPSPPAARRISREGAREKSFRRAQRKMAADSTPPVMPRRGTVAS